MPYMVTFQGTDGKSGFHLCQDKPEALRMAEHFRNSDEIAELAVYRADEIPLEFKTYYRAEFTSEPSAVRMDEVVVEEAEGLEPEPAPVEAVPEIPPLEQVEATEPSAEADPQETTFGIFSRP